MLWSIDSEEVDVDVVVEPVYNPGNVLTVAIPPDDPSRPPGADREKSFESRPSS